MGWIEASRAAQEWPYVIAAMRECASKDNEPQAMRHLENLMAGRQHNFVRSIYPKLDVLPRTIVMVQGRMFRSGHAAALEIFRAFHGGLPWPKEVCTINHNNGRRAYFNFVIPETVEGSWPQVRDAILAAPFDVPPGLVELMEAERAVVPVLPPRPPRKNPPPELKPPPLWSRLLKWFRGCLTDRQPP